MKSSKYLTFAILFCSINNNYVKSSQVINIPQDYYNIIDNHDTLDLYNNRDMANLSTSLNKLHPRTESGSSNNSLATNMTDKPDELQPIQEQNAHDIMLSPTFNSNSESDDEGINNTNSGLVTNVINITLHYINKVSPIVSNNLSKQQKLQDWYEEKLKKMLTNAKDHIQRQKYNVSESFYKYQQIQSNGIKIIVSTFSDQMVKYQKLQNKSINTICSKLSNIVSNVASQASNYQSVQEIGLNQICSIIRIPFDCLEEYLGELDQDSKLDHDSESDDNNIICGNDNNTIYEEDCDDVLNNSAI